MGKELFVQVDLIYEDNSQEKSWIPLSFAKVNKQIILGKNKNTGLRAKVIQVYSEVKLTQEQIDLNRENYFGSIEDWQMS